MPRPKRDVLIENSYTSKQLDFIKVLKKELSANKKPNSTFNISDYEIHYGGTHIYFDIWKKDVVASGFISLDEVDRTGDIKTFAWEKLEDLYRKLEDRIILPPGELRVKLI